MLKIILNPFHIKNIRPITQINRLTLKSNTCLLEQHNEMPQVLSNSNIEVIIDRPLEGYTGSRFDWTGKIRQIYFKGQPMLTTERHDDRDHLKYGEGLYNEFGIKHALGFEEIRIGEQFHKIGIGLLTKESSTYKFNQEHKVEAADFSIDCSPLRMSIHCIGKACNGYAYHLKKEISLLSQGLIIDYQLINQGNRIIKTTEYTHNFLNIPHSTAHGVQVSLPMAIDLQRCEELVNPEKLAVVSTNHIRLVGHPSTAIYYSNLSGDQKVPATWTKINEQTKVSIQETGDFRTNQINLWGLGHVISPELFYLINLAPEQQAKWSRKYTFEQLLD